MTTLSAHWEAEQHGGVTVGDATPLAYGQFHDIPLRFSLGRMGRALRGVSSPLRSAHFYSSANQSDRQIAVVALHHQSLSSFRSFDGSKAIEGENQGVDQSEQKLGRKSQGEKRNEYRS